MPNFAASAVGNECSVIFCNLTAHPPDVVNEDSSEMSDLKVGCIFSFNNVLKLQPLIVSICLNFTEYKEALSVHIHRFT